jgi:plastocyanin
MRYLVVALVAAGLAAPVAVAGAPPAPRHGAEAAKKKRLKPCRRRTRHARAACRRRVACESRARRRYRRRPAARRRAIRRCRRPPRKPAPAESSPSPLPVAPAPAVAKPPVTTPAAPPPPVLAHRVQVHAREYYFTLSRPEVASGDVTVELLNRGEDPHDLRLRPPGGGADLALPEVPSLGQTTQTVGLTPGNWTLYCSLEGHEALGMRATLRVR